MLPLKGIVVVDLSRALAGPYCTTMLADFGADVIKVEGTKTGDPARTWPPFDQEGRSLYFESVNRNKRSVTIDFYSPEGREMLGRLIKQADVLVENFKFGTLGKMGFDDELLTSINPDLLHVAINAYGARGPLRDLPGLDQVIQGISGLTSVTGPENGTGYRVGLPIIDISSGMTAAFGIVSALLGKQRGVQASVVSTSLFETALALSVFQGQQAISLHQAPQSQGNSHPSITPYGAYPTASESIIVAVSTERHWNSFTKIVGHPEWQIDPRFLDGKLRTAHRHELESLICEALSADSADRWIAKFGEAGIPSGPINDYKQALESDQAEALEMVTTVRRQDGTSIGLVRSPLSIDGVAMPISAPPPVHGEHTVEVLREIGVEEEDIFNLLDSGIVSSAPVKDHDAGWTMPEVGAVAGSGAGLK